MYYRLKEPWAFRGWKKLPFAIRAMAGEKKHDGPIMLKKEPFLELLCCNGEEDVDISTFSEKGRKIIQEMTKAGLMDQSPEPLPPLASFQRYHVYPSRYLKGAHWSITGKCNFQCRHCLVSAPAAHHPQLPLSDCLHIVDEMAIEPEIVCKQNEEGAVCEGEIDEGKYTLTFDKEGVPKTFSLPPYGLTITFDTFTENGSAAPSETTSPNTQISSHFPMNTIPIFSPSHLSVSSFRYCGHKRCGAIGIYFFSTANLENALAL